ncbi:MAG: hypothetical protein M1269_13390 [Chloroflexi bacterium]|nr:hypothetical protein [Chloroflexota bacterium]
MDPELKELLAYLDEVIEDYQRYVFNIGKNGLAASLMLYYRDEVQDLLEELQYEEDLDLTDRWRRVGELDKLLRENQEAAVKEIGHNSFKQYQIVNDPPRSHWWWYLDRVTPAPEADKKFWEFWKH